MFPVTTERFLEQIIEPVVSEVAKGGAAARFQVRSLDHTTALIRIQILTYTANDAEVVFGWNFSEKDVGRVFSSRDAKLVRYFADLYSRLEQDGQDIKFKDLMGGGSTN